MRLRSAFGGAMGAALALLGAVAQAAPDAFLEVTHSAITTGADGIKRTTEFTERVQRQGSTVWVERLLPAALHKDEEHHKANTAHKHADLGTAVRWIERSSSGKPQLRLVAQHDQVLVNIAPAEFATVGFDGSWLSAYHLIDPVVLKKLQPGPKQGSAQWYASAPQNGSTALRILWDPVLELPLQVQSQSADGLSNRRTSVRVLPAQAKQPWKATGQYAVKDYSDFLD